MIEVTQADRDAANKLFDAILNDVWHFAEFGLPSYQEDALQTMIQAFAAHRVAIEAKIVDWMRAIGDEFSLDDPHRLADLIEAEEHLK
jgi:hypothetical protein